MKKGKKMDAKQNGSRCKARTKAGKPCRAAATAGGLCFFHANPEKASELGRSAVDDVFRASQPDSRDSFSAKSE